MYAKIVATSCKILKWPLVSSSISQPEGPGFNPWRGRGLKFGRLYFATLNWCSLTPRREPIFTYVCSYLLIYLNVVSSYFNGVTFVVVFSLSF